MLTRREQLGLAAKGDEKTDGEKAPAKGGGRGRGKGGKGRGRGGRGKKQGDPEDMEVEKVASKRPPEKTPEKSPGKNLNGDEFEGSPKKSLAEEFEKAVAASPPIRQEKKRSKAAAKEKAKEDKEGVEVKKQEKKDTQKTDQKTEEVPKESRRSKKAKKDEGDTEKKEGVEEKEEVDKEKKQPRPPSKSQVDVAKHEMMEYKDDPASWAHVERLYEATKISERECTPKSMYWSYSMYWGTHRVGLLQKQTSGKNTHVTSLGGGHCIHIGIPTEACKMVVGASLIFKENEFVQFCLGICD